MNVKCPVFSLPVTPEIGNYFDPSEPVPEGQEEKLSHFKYLLRYRLCDEYRSSRHLLHGSLQLKEAGCSDLHIFSHSSMPNSYLTFFQFVCKLDHLSAHFKAKRNV